MNALRYIAFSAALFAASLCAQSPLGQISQMHPELCGNPQATIPLPANIAASFDTPSGYTQLLFLHANAVEKRLDLAGAVDWIDEVCPISNQRLLIFGSNSDGAVVFLIDQAKFAIIDSIQCFRPTISPNQRWLAYRKFYPRHTSAPPSAEYLLYDLQRTPEQNRPGGGSMDDNEDVGRTIFPKGLKNEPFDHLSPPESRLHRDAGGFFWTQDSHLLLFGDTLQHHFSIIAVTITETGQTEAKIHGVEFNDVCPSTALPDEAAVAIAGADAELTNSGDRLISVNFAQTPGVCEPKPVQVNLSEFQEPPTETYIQPKRKKAFVDLGQ